MRMLCSKIDGYPSYSKIHHTFHAKTLLGIDHLISLWDNLSLANEKISLLNSFSIKVQGNSWN